MKTAKTLSGILDNWLVANALDRSRPIGNAVAAALQSWQQDLERRKPSPAAEDGKPDYMGTDLDLFTFLYALAERNAVINIPEYCRMRAKARRSDEWVVSENNRHGRILCIASNSKTHAFSLVIQDHNVVQVGDSELVGRARNFGIVDDNGELYSGLEQFEFSASDKEEAFLDFYRIWKENEIDFESFVHPQLAKALYGSRYLATKAVYQRVVDQAEHYRNLANELWESGVRLGGKRSSAFYERCESLSYQAVCLESRLSLPGFKGKYPVMGITKEGGVVDYAKMPMRYSERQNVLRYASRASRLLSYKVRPRLQAPVRAVELAFFKHGFYNGLRECGNEIRPGWDVPEWRQDYKTGPKSRISWNALELAPEAALLYRIRGVAARKAA